MNSTSSTSILNWSAAEEVLIGLFRPSEYARIILPFIVMRRLECIEVDLPFQNTSKLNLSQIHSDPVNALTNFNNYVDGYYSSVSDFLEAFSTKQVIKKLNAQNLLCPFIENFIKVDLHETIVCNTQMGLIFQDLLRQVSKSTDRSRGEFFSPPELTKLSASLLKPEAGMRVYDPTSGSGGMLIAACKYISEQDKDPSVLSLYGQEINFDAWAVSRMNMLMHGLFDVDIRLGDTLNDPKHLSKNGSLKKFDRIISSPPFGARISINDDNFERFTYGLPYDRKADFAFIQHMIASLNTDGKMVIIVTAFVLFGEGPDKIIRDAIIKDDLIETIIELPPSLFRQTGIPVYVLVISKNKQKDKTDKILFIGAEQGYEKSVFQNILRDIDLEKITSTYENWKEEENYSEFITKDELEAENYYIHDIIAKRRFSRLRLSNDSQYNTFEQLRLKDVALQIRRLRVDEKIKSEENVIFVPALGKSQVVCKQIDAKLKPQNLYAVYLKTDIVQSEYLAAFFNSEVGIMARQAKMGIWTIPKLNKRTVGSLDISIPSLGEQEKIIGAIQKFDQIKSHMDQIETNLSLYPIDDDLNEEMDSLLKSVGKLSKEDSMLSLVRQGESKTLEFKETLSLNKKSDSPKRDKMLEHSVLKTIAAFLNTDGGTLLVGVNDSGSFTGLDEEITFYYGKHKEPRDKFMLHFKSLIKEFIGAEFYPFLDPQLINIKNSLLLKIQCNPSNTEVFVKNEFFVRTNPATDKLEGKKQIDYIRERFDESK